MTTEHITMCFGKLMIEQWRWRKLSHGWSRSDRAIESWVGIWRGFSVIVVIRRRWCPVTTRSVWAPDRPINGVEQTSSLSTTLRSQYMFGFVWIFLFLFLHKVSCLLPEGGLSDGNKFGLARTSFFPYLELPYHSWSGALGPENKQKWKILRFGEVSSLCQSINGSIFPRSGSNDVFLHVAVLVTLRRNVGDPSAETQTSSQCANGQGRFGVWIVLSTFLPELFLLPQRVLYPPFIV